MQFNLNRGQHQLEHRAALLEGLRRHGAERLGSRFVACWGWRSGRPFRRRGLDVLMLERGYIGDRFYWTSIGWNGLNGRATFPEYPIDNGERFSRMGELKPWNPDGDYILIVGQVTGDMSLRGKNLYPWYQEKAREAREYYGLPVVFRPHPVEVKRNRVRETGLPVNKGSLSDALENAAVVVTFNSNTGVDALLAGKPTICHDEGSMAWGVAGHAIGEECKVELREEWAHSLAFKQWSLDEIRSGEALVGVVEYMKWKSR